MLPYKGLIILGKYTSPAIDGQDLVVALQAIEQDTGCKARVLVSLNDQGHLTCRVEAYTSNNGVRLGVATHTVWWANGDGKVLAKLLLAVHRVYHQADRMAHRGITNK